MTFQRTDDRAPDELRPVRITPGFLPNAEGSALIEMGNTRVICRSLRAISNRRVLGDRTITLDCDVLQADGGTRTAAITGAYVAFAIACKRLMKERRITKSPIICEVAAVR